MDLLLIAFWFLLVVLIPIVFFSDSKSSFEYRFETTSIGLRSVFSVVVYIAVSLVAGMLIILITIGPDPKPGRVFSFGEFIAGLIVILGYGAIGRGLCSLVAVRFVNFKMFWNNEETKQVILDLE